MKQAMCELLPAIPKIAGLRIVYPPILYTGTSHQLPPFPRKRLRFGLTMRWKEY